MMLIPHEKHLRRVEGLVARSRLRRSYIVGRTPYLGSDGIPSLSKCSRSAFLGFRLVGGCVQVQLDQPIKYLDDGRRG